MGKKYTITNIQSLIHSTYKIRYSGSFKTWDSTDLNYPYVTSHRNLSQIGTCYNCQTLFGRDTIFGDVRHEAEGKWMGEYSCAIYRRLYVPAKLARFMRS